MAVYTDLCGIFLWVLFSEKTTYIKREFLLLRITIRAWNQDLGKPMRVTEIFLLTPPGSTSERLYSMSEAGQLCAVLRQRGFATEIIDGGTYGNNFQNILHLVRDAHPILVALTLQWDDLKESPWVRSMIKGLQSDRFHLTLEGRSATIYYRPLLETYCEIDSVLVGEGEDTIVELAEKVAREEDWRSIRGIAFMRNGEVMLSPYRAPIGNLDALPLAVRDYLKRRRDYPIAPLYTGRSCYGRCSFCSGRLFRDVNSYSGYRARSAKNVVDEIEMLVRDYKAHLFYFVDDNFIGDREKGKKRAAEIAQEIMSRGLRIRFYIECRVNDVERALFLLLKKAGLRKVFLGIESGAQSALDRYNKGTTVEMNKEALRILKEISINVDPGFIMFDPNTTLKELKQNLRFIKETNLHLCDSRVSIFNKLIIHPGSEAETDFVKSSKPSSNLTFPIEGRYPIVDPKADLVEKTIRFYRGEIARRHHIYGDLLRKWTANPSYTDRDITAFKLKLGRWKDSIPSLNIRILERAIHVVDHLEQVTEDVIHRLRNLVHAEIASNELRHFGRFFREENTQKQSV